MLEDILTYCNNYFEKERATGTFTTRNGSITLPLLTGQYFRIVGSALNDGVYRYPTSGLKDETFEGEIWHLAIPPRLVSLAERIRDWTIKNKDVLDAPYRSESFGGYSYTKDGGNDSLGGSWQSQFANELRPFMKL